MTEEDEGPQKVRRWFWLAVAGIAAILIVLFVPPLVSVSRYKNQVAALVASSLGRPVHLSAVSLRLLPRPGFVLDDLTVDDDPAFGSEPVLHASTVTAPISLFSLWQGKLEIGEISVDDASVNLVRTPDGRWNLDPLLQNKTPSAGRSAAASAKAFPYLKATNSRVNFKSGVEKLPFSLTNADLSVWEENPGEWRLRLRGQPVRTDVSVNTGDTGIVELDATAHRAPELQRIPVHLDLEWRDAQLGQLSRLITGSDAGWRGDLRGEIHVDGTADSAKITTRLRANGVHRAEFAPVAPMDFDANCSLVYRYFRQAVENLVCDSPLGDGHVRLAGDVPGNGDLPHYSLELDHVPAGAGLDALRTFRSGVDPALQASGTVSGKLNYAESPAGSAAQTRLSVAPSRKKTNLVQRDAPARGPLTGSLTVEGLRLSGSTLSRPLQAPKFVLEPSEAAAGHLQMLAGTVALPVGAPVPIILSVGLGPRGYQLTAHGQISIPRARELAQVAGLKQAVALQSLAGDPLTVGLDAQGPWLPSEESLPGGIQPGGLAAGAVSGLINSFGPQQDTTPSADTLNATITVRNANWKADFLVNHVQITAATLHVDNRDVRWDPVDFTYGPLQGTASLEVPKQCADPAPCPPQTTQLNLHFGDVDAAVLQAAMLGAREKGTLLSDLIDRLHPSSAPAWPEVNASISADSLTLGPVTLEDVTGEVRLASAGAEITNIQAKLLGGTVHAGGTITGGDKPAYALTADFEDLSPSAVGQLLGETWRGGTLDANGKVELLGYTAGDLSGSAKGALHADWWHGSISSTSADDAAPPPALRHFDRWTADVKIADGKVTLADNQVTQGSRKYAVTAGINLAEPLKISFGAVKQTQAKKR